MSRTVICKDVFGNEYPTNVDDLVQRIGVYAVIIKDGKILLARQWGGYSMVGGGVEKGETLEDAFVREVKEETGLSATPGKLIYQTTTLFQKDENSKPKQSFQFYFVHKDIQGVITNDGITKNEGGYTNDVAEWVGLEDAAKIELRHTVSLKTILDAYKDRMRA